MKKIAIKLLMVLSVFSQVALAQNTGTKNMNQDSTSLVPAGNMSSVNTSIQTSTSTLVSSVMPFTGTCGASSSSILTTAPTSFLCNTGVPSAVTTSGLSYYWTCSGNNYGNAANVASCSAQQRVVGQCGSDNGKTLSSSPTNLCAAGTPSNVSLNGSNYAWSCNGNYGAPANCSASITAIGNYCTTPKGTSIPDGVTVTTPNYNRAVKIRCTYDPKSGRYIGSGNEATCQNGKFVDDGVPWSCRGSGPADWVYL